MCSFRNIKRNICQLLDVNEKDITYITQLGGLTNKNYKVKINKGRYVVRLPGKGTNKMINRKNEYICNSLAIKLGITPELVYFDDKSGIKICSYISDAGTMNSKSLKLYHNMKLAAQLLRRLHTCGATTSVIFDVFDVIKNYENLLMKSNSDFFPDYEDIRKKVMALNVLEEKLDINTIVPCHNDPVPENFIKSCKTGKMFLIDWEYAGMNDLAWDLAAISAECGFTERDDKMFIRLYLDVPPKKDFIIRFLINKIYVDFVWSLWGKLRSVSGDDVNGITNFDVYARHRFERAKMNIDNFKKGAVYYGSYKYRL